MNKDTEYLNDDEKKMWVCRYLLPDPGSEVVGKCLKTINELRKTLEGLK